MLQPRTVYAHAAPAPPFQMDRVRGKIIIRLVLIVPLETGFEV
jgi:hypothetical protein